MKSLISLKPWALFVLTWVLPLLIITYSFSGFVSSTLPFIIATAIFGFFSYGWIWSIANSLHPLLPENVHMNLQRFRVLFGIPVTYFVLLLIGLTYWSFTGSQSGLISDSLMVFLGTVIVVLHLSSVVIIIWSIRFAAKTLKSVEIGRMAHAGDYILEFFLIWISFIGMWFIQPKLNKLHAHHTENEQ